MLGNLGKRILIIGTGNIGFSVLKELNDSYNDIEITVINRELHGYLQDYLSMCNSSNVLHFIKADPTSADDMDKVSKDARVSNINVLISTVGCFAKSFDPEGFIKEFNVNFYGNVIPIKSLTRHIKTNENNRIIIISSTSGNKVPADINSYAPSKWALESFASALQQECLSKGIFVDIIRPTTIINEYSRSFTTKKGISIKVVAKEIIKRVNFSIKNEPIKGNKTFIPKYFYTIRILERVFPGVLNYLSGLSPLFIRKRNYKKYPFEKVLITGGSSGLGRQLSFLYSNHAKELIITGRNEDKLREVKNQITKTSNCKVRTLNISFDSIHELNKLEDVIQEIDLLVNNAGEYMAKSVDETRYEDYARILNTNFFSAVFLTSHLVRSKRFKKIINILSSSAIVGRKDHSAYSASKSALWAYSRSLRRHYGNDIQILEVIPSTFNSDLFRNSKSPSIPSTLLKSNEVAKRVYFAERYGKDIIYIPSKVRFFLLLECLFYPVFRRIYLN